MPVAITATPNPNALKFTVGVDVGGPKTFVAGRAVDDAIAEELLAVAGVTSVFMSSDFVTLSKLPDADWADIVAAAGEILARHFG